MEIALWIIAIVEIIRAIQKLHKLDDNKNKEPEAVVPVPVVCR